MSRTVRALTLACGALTLAVALSACGTERIEVPRSDAALYHGAVLFSQRCAGCHTLSYAGTHGSAPNIRTALAISGPNFDQRCERPVIRVLYAIENGGFSGAYMPQNIVVGQDAVDVARFVATYSGRQAPPQVGILQCEKQALGTLPPVYGADNAGAVALAGSSGSSGSSTGATATAASSSRSGHGRKPAAKHKS